MKKRKNEKNFIEGFIMIFEKFLEKIDPAILLLIKNEELSLLIPVIIQTTDGLMPEDYNFIEAGGGKIKDDLKIINAFSADIRIDKVFQTASSERVSYITYDAKLMAI